MLRVVKYELHFIVRIKTILKSSAKKINFIHCNLKHDCYDVIQGFHVVLSLMIFVRTLKVFSIHM
eukprot:snap_masked-scaffold_2-processed-gene-9.39-mRNA-1 protein AED:1.00 eAED:1.00 QI:0/0/0/0/1/1/3/0/64